MLGTLAVWWGVSALGFFIACFPFLTGARARQPQVVGRAGRVAAPPRIGCPRLRAWRGRWTRHALLTCFIRPGLAVIGFAGGLARPFGASLAAILAFLPFKVGTSYLPCLRCCSTAACAVRRPACGAGPCVCLPQPPPTSVCQLDSVVHLSLACLQIAPRRFPLPAALAPFQQGVWLWCPFVLNLASLLMAFGRGARAFGQGEAWHRALVKVGAVWALR